MLKLTHISKTFNPGTVNEKVALNGVSLHMEAGDFATIVGSNGAGKSTLFNAITGGFIADEGSILLGGQDITFEPEHQRSKVIGHLFQDPLKGTAPNMTIEENLALAYLRAGTAPHAIFSRISRKDKKVFREKLALLDMGLEDRMKQPVGLLSGGESHHRRVEREIGDKADGGQVGGAIFIQRTDQSQRIGGRIDSGLHNVQFFHVIQTFLRNFSR